MTKAEILSKIRQTAAENGGVPLGVRLFERQTGIRQGEWFGIHWRSWGDAVREAGLTVNPLSQRISDDDLLASYAQLTKELGRVPTKGDLRLAKRRNPAIPTETAFTRRFGSYKQLRSRAHEYCARHAHLSELLPLLALKGQGSEAPAQPDHDTVQIGFVYLIKHGARAEYKIGKTVNPVRREGELRLELPEPVRPVHYIETDDPAGVEAYWHSRFAAKRKQGEWFALSAEDVRAFKKWRRIS